MTCLYEVAGRREDELWSGCGELDNRPVYIGIFGEHIGTGLLSFMGHSVIH